jgi:diguanylate cyclase (GGDEF)-like protein
MRAKSPLSLILMDIDFFKPFNDNYGHAEGDECLKKVALALSSCITRTTDLVARYGGEEFVSVLPETDAEGLVKFGEKLRQGVSDLRVPHEHSKAENHVTISLGGIAVIPTSEEKLEDLVPAADRNLYQAKEQGRNRLIS